MRTFLSALFFFTILFSLLLLLQLYTNENIVIAVLGFPSVSFPTTLKKQHKKTLVAGIGILASTLEANFTKFYNTDYQLEGFINCHINEKWAVRNSHVINLEAVNNYLENNIIDEIVIALSGTPVHKIHNILKIADYYGVRVKYLPDYSTIFGKRQESNFHKHLIAINVRQFPLDDKYFCFLKNWFDKIFSLTILVALAPVFLAIALLIKCTSAGPIFYCPIRIGKAGRPFRVFKFRTMSVPEIFASQEILSTTENDSRITRLGRILRKYSLDELPQFLNVLLGEMSVVGPRPHRKYLNHVLQESVQKYMIRQYVKPGITGWAQVNGWRGPLETPEQKNNCTRYDLWYIRHWSFILDLKIIYLTIFSKKAHKNAF